MSERAKTNRARLWPLSCAIAKMSPDILAVQEVATRPPSGTRQERTLSTGRANAEAGADLSRQQVVGAQLGLNSSGIAPVVGLCEGARQGLDRLDQAAQAWLCDHERSCRRGCVGLPAG
jgi:hypothetical protein